MFLVNLNAGTIGVSIILILIVGLVVYKMIKDKKSGKGSCSCGGNCSCCGMAGSCHGTGNDLNKEQKHQ
ncbi:MAG: FeoB-associated Cys-rich membrane protein [Lachnospiraceae bacterium]|nr:FeoB-associated Cys-rich membrane protein [Lachnospiraceae bacterium]